MKGLALPADPRRWLRAVRERISLPEDTRVLILSPLIGAGAGLGVVFFRRAVEGLSGALLSPGFPWWVRLGIPALAGIAVAGILHRLREPEETAGVAGLILAVATAGGRLPYGRAPARILAAILSISAGASLGPEDPSVQIGANLGSAVAQQARISEGSMRLLVAAGAAGGIAAAFNAPIAGVLFATEILLGEFATAPITALILGAVAANLVAQVFLGPYPAFQVPAYSFRHPLEVLLYMALGLAAAGVAVAYIKLVYGMRDGLARLRLPPWVRTPAGGMILGLVGLWAPQALGVGYASVEQVLQGQPFRPEVAVALMGLKLILTPFSLAVGFVGGLFAPALFIGAMLGYAYGALLQGWIPGWVALPSAYAMVGMAAVLAGAVRAPFTAILLLFEMTRDYRIIPPLMAAVGVSMLLSERLHPGSLYTEALRRRGLRLSRSIDVDLMESIYVHEVMNPDVVRIPSELPVESALEQLTQRRRRTAVVEASDGTLEGIVTLRDLEAAVIAGRSGEPVGRIARRPVVTVSPEATVGEAIRRMSTWDIGQVPVVSPEDPGRVLGIVRREEVIRAYDVALSRKRLLQHQLEMIRLRAFSGMELAEVPVEPGAPACGQPLERLRWPADCRIAVIRRGLRTLIPNGRTVLQPGDRVVLMGQPEALREAQGLLRAPAREAGGR